MWQIRAVLKYCKVPKYDHEDCRYCRTVLQKSKLKLVSLDSNMIFEEYIDQKTSKSDTSSKNLQRLNNILEFPKTRNYILFLPKSALLTMCNIFKIFRIHLIDYVIMEWIKNHRGPALCTALCLLIKETYSWMAFPQSDSKSIKQEGVLLSHYPTMSSFLFSWVFLILSRFYLYLFIPWLVYFPIVITCSDRFFYTLRLNISDTKRN